VAFCTQCGKPIGAGDFFCGQCGARQPIPGTPPGVYRPPAAPGVSPRTAAMFCYVPFFGWIASILVLASERFRTVPAIRFDAFQGLYLFVAWLLVDWVGGPWFHFPMHFFPLRGILKLLLIGASIFMIVKASREEHFHLPIIGDLAERSL
jgi:uncharacterized membrane protein